VKVGEIGAEENPEMPENRTAKTAKTPDGGSKTSEEAQNRAAKTTKTNSRPSKTSKTLAEADRLGLVATWAREFGYVSIHDPTTRTWHDVPTKEAPRWAVGEAARRKDLHKSGNRRAYSLTARQVEELWEAERPPEEEGIVEDYPVEEGK
jgi:hypothetical protein